MKSFAPLSIGPPLGALEFDAQHNASHNTGGGGESPRGNYIGLGEIYVWGWGV